MLLLETQAPTLTRSARRAGANLRPGRRLFPGSPAPGGRKGRRNLTAPRPAGKIEARNDEQAKAGHAAATLPDARLHRAFSFLDPGTGTQELRIANWPRRRPRGPRR